MIVFDNSNEKIVIRPLKSSDWYKLWVFINTISSENTYISYQGQKITQSFEKAYVKTELKRQRSHQGLQLLMLNQTETVVGSANLDLRMRAEKHVGDIGISLLPDYRGRGLGNIFLNHLLTHAETWIPQLKIASLNVMANNQVAIKLYTKTGFKVYGQLPRGIEHRNHMVDQIMMFKKIRD